MKSLSTEWTRHIRDAKQKEQAVKSIKGSAFALSLLQRLIQKAETDVDLQMSSVKDFDNPNWPNATAYRLGKKAGFQEVLRHLSFLDPQE
jgi:hypothetical protein